MILLMVCVSSPLFAEPDLSVSVPVSRNGFFILEYQGASAEHCIAEFRKGSDGIYRREGVLYKGKDRRTTVSGRENGFYAFSSDCVSDIPVDPVFTEVRHYSLYWVSAVFFTGLTVFLLTAGFLFAGIIRTRRDYEN